MSVPVCLVESKTFLGVCGKLVVYFLFDFYSFKTFPIVFLFFSIELSVY